MDNYEINDNTIALIFNNFKTLVYEKGNSFYVDKLPNEIIKYSCEYFGCSFKGRVDGTKYLTGLTHKPPIIVEESNEIIFFPLSSPRLNSCSWIRSKYINNYSKYNTKSIVTTINGSKIVLDCSYEILNNQILRSSRLESIIRYRKNMKLL